MPAIMRVGDTGTGVCNAHTSPVACTITFTSGAATVNAEGRAVCTIGSVGVTSCGHTSKATTGSSTVMVEGKGVHRAGDTGILIPSGSYTAGSSSSHTSAN